MNFWYWYLLAAAALSFTGYITLNIFLCGVLAVLVHLQARLLAAKGRLPAGLAAAVTAALALALLWRESFLPSSSTLISFLANPATRPSPEFIINFLLQSVNIPMLAAGLALFAAVFFAARKKPVHLFFAVYLLLVTAWVMQPKQGIAGGGDTPEAFFARESSRVTDFPRSAPTPPPFDVIILHICSLSWKDVKDSRSDLLPFLSGFDYVFTNFSSATGYSKPAAMRVFKSPCGQVPSSRIFENAPPGCYLMDDLRGSGFKTYTMLSHDGKYDDYTGEIQKYGHADKPLGLDGLPVEYHMFDGTLLYSDKAALEKFWKVRQAVGAPRAALYYNTVNLHIGTHRADGSGPKDDAEAYKARLAEMTAQFDAFFAVIEKSGRNAVVVLVPEHGAALTGTKMQPKDVREIPLPPIAAVPAAVKLIGKGFYAESGPRVITKPASLQALAWLLAEFLRHNPYTKDARKPGTIAAEIPVTGFFAENYDSAVMKADLGYIFKVKGGAWAPLPAYAGIPDGTIPEPGDFKRAAR